MKPLAEQLDKAFRESRKPERVPLTIGQFVEVRTRTGDLVLTGTIQALSPRTKTIWVSDTGSGSDLQVEVDISMYDVWVQDYAVPGGAPTPSKQPELNLRGSNPGVATLGKRYRVFQP